MICAKDYTSYYNLISSFLTFDHSNLDKSMGFLLKNVSKLAAFLTRCPQAPFAAFAALDAQNDTNL